MEINVKRIIDGLTYNTDTSTLLARAEWEFDNQFSPYHGLECGGELYQTRGGAFFVATTIHVPGDKGREPKDKVEFAPLSPERAQAWLLEGEVEVYRNPFEDPPEAGAEAETGATIYIRVPAALKRDVDEAAKEARVSGNVWAMRCVERCLEGFPNEMTAIWQIASWLSLTWSTDKTGEDVELDAYKLEKAIEALEEISDLVRQFSQRWFGTDDIKPLDGNEGMDLNRRFQPYPE
jgi:hypothetical protein